MLNDKGKHIVASLITETPELLNQFIGCKNVLDKAIGDFSLVNLGEVYHNFLPVGFTAVVCLSESHISIHTWPEKNLINLDIYLSNYQRNNENTVELIFERLVEYFNASIINKQTLLR